MTTHRVLATLTRSGLIEQRVETGRYRIGPELYMLGSIYLETTDVIIAAQPVIRKLNELTGENINLSIFDKGSVVIVMKEEALYSFRYDRHVGSILPAYASAMGKALLSELSDAELDSIYPTEKFQKFTKKTIASKTELKRELEQIRKTGVSFDQEGYTEGIVGFGSIIRDVRGVAVAAIGTGLPVFRIHQNGVARMGTLIRLGANLISYRLGYQDAAHPVRDIQEIVSWWQQSQTDSARKAASLFLDGRITYFDAVTEAKKANVL